MSPSRKLGHRACWLIRETRAKLGVYALRLGQEPRDLRGCDEGPAGPQDPGPGSGFPEDRAPGGRWAQLGSHVAFCSHASLSLQTLHAQTALPELRAALSAKLGMTYCREELKVTQMSLSNRSVKNKQQNHLYKEIGCVY